MRQVFEYKMLTINVNRCIIFTIDNGKKNKNISKICSSKYLRKCVNSRGYRGLV